MYNKVYVEITNICNMNCSFCHGHKRQLRQMSEEEFTYILDKLQGYTKYIYYHLMGEPLTHPSLPGFIKLANECGYKSIITTNGTLLNKKGNKLIEAGIHKINVSLHSFEKMNEEQLESYVYTLADFAKTAANHNTIVVFRLWNNGFDDDKNNKAISILKDKIVGDWTENTRGIKVRHNIYLEYGDRFEWPDKNADIRGKKYFCYGLKDQFGILSDGTVVPCCLDSEGVIALGNVFEDDVDSILKSPRATSISNGFKCGKAAEDLCKRCGYAQRFV